MKKILLLLLLVLFVPNLPARELKKEWREYERIARKEEALALITGESVGQVASQTIEALTVTNEVVGMPVFRPLIGFDKIDIMEYARKIGTYDTSILPYEDCCTVFTPRHPATKPKEALIEKGENALDQEKLIQSALDNTEIVEL